MQTPLYILGSSGHAREVAYYARLLWPERPIFFVDDRAEGHLSVAEYQARQASDGGESVLGAGRCETRRRMMAEIRPPFASIIHPMAAVMGEVGAGCVLAPGAVIAPHACLESHVMVNYNATVGHDTVIGQFSVVSPGAAVGGWCQVGEAVYIGAGALIRERLSIGQDAIIGMGAVVTKDVPPHQVAVGVPAQLSDKQSGGWQ